MGAGLSESGIALGAARAVTPERMPSCNRAAAAKFGLNVAISSTGHEAESTRECLNKATFQWHPRQDLLVCHQVRICMAVCCGKSFDQPGQLCGFQPNFDVGIGIGDVVKADSLRIRGLAGAGWYGCAAIATFQFFF